MKDLGQIIKNVADEAVKGVEKAGTELEGGMRNVGQELKRSADTYDQANSDNLGKIRKIAEGDVKDARQDTGVTGGGGGAEPLKDPAGGEDVPEAGVKSGGVSSAETGATDPVDLVSGQLLDSVIDFSLPGVLPLVLRRSYASGYEHGALLGPGWSSTLDIRLLTDTEGAVRFLGDDAQCLDFGVPKKLAIQLGQPVYPVYGSRWALRQDTRDGTWTVTNPRTGVSYVFGDAGPVRPLAAIRDRSGNQIRVHRDEDGRPVLVEHSGGYRIRVELALTPSGPRLAGYDLEGGGRLAGFGYDGAGCLTRVSDSLGTDHRYSYDAHARMSGWVDRSGFEYSYAYDESGRVVETGEPGGFKHAEISYDRQARATSVTDAVGHTTVYRYDAYQQITSVTDPLGHQATFRKDLSGRLLAHTSPLGRTTGFTLDADGNQTRVDFPDGQSLAMTYAGPGRLAQVDLPDGGTWQYTWDDHGNVVTETDPLGAVTSFGYDDRGGVTEITDPLGAVQRFENDAAGLPVAAIDSDGARTTITRDHHGRVVGIRAPDGTVATTERDSEGRVTAQTGPDGSVTRYAYDAAGNQTAVTDPSGRATVFEYGPFYVPVARVDPDGARYAFGYDAELRLTTVTGPTGLTWTYGYDENGQQTFERDFDGLEQTFAFDKDGRLTARTAADGEVTAYQRDEAARLTEVRTGGEVSTFGYDPVGRLIRAENEHATVTIDRDLLGRAVREDVNGRAVTRSYDAAGNLSERVTPSGAVSRWGYDSAGDAASLVAGPQTLTFNRDSLGREILRQVGDITLAQDYDASGQLTRQRVTASGRTLTERTYGYDDDGLPTRVADLLRGTRDLELDPAGRITGVLSADRSERYAYDAIGNVTSVDPGGGDRGTTEGTRVTHSGRTAYEYDARGRLAGKTIRTLSGQRQTWSYEWSAQDRLTSVTRPDGQRWTYAYDALGRRIEKTRLTPEGDAAETTRFTWDGTTLAEQSAREGDSPDITLTWDYEPGSYRPAVQRRSAQPCSSSQDADDAEFWAIVTDLTGTPQELVSPDGTIDWAQRTLLWGRPPGTGDSGGSDALCPIGFPGQYQDAETGLAYNNQRYYDPGTGYYLSPDPVGLGAAPHPQRYVSNPLVLTDPLGLTPSGPAGSLKTDAQLQSDADSIHQGFRQYNLDRATARKPNDPDYIRSSGNRAANGTTVSTYQADDGSLHYSVNKGKTYPGMDAHAQTLGYGSGSRVFGKQYLGENQTDAEQVMLNAVDKGRVPDSGRIATSRVPCTEIRPSGKPGQNCSGRIASYPNVRLVGRYGSGQ